ncbi:VacJ family lipoprotein [Ferrimonas gelatinilytica]|uniref:VacJ family lipoprotein n=1 Tax=Ferrimonas gelatinilytica TaxID=1255257 RepID=A0ABP9S9W6_9GAMM
MTASSSPVQADYIFLYADSLGEGTERVEQAPAEEDPLLDAALDELYGDMDEEAIAQSQKDGRDPLEPMNRAFWIFNYRYFDRYFARPVVHFYVDYVPKPAQKGVENFVRNLDEPFSAVNNLLQWKPADAANATARFLINSTVGVVGIMDIAADMGLERKQDKFGEVLGVWGVGNGPYLMIPVLGPSSVREEVGDWVDRLYFPYSLLGFWQLAGRWALDGLVTRAKLVEQEALLDSSLDPYSFTKEAYFQYSEFRLYDGAPPTEEEDAWLDEYLDENE